MSTSIENDSTEVVKHVRSILVSLLIVCLTVYGVLALNPQGYARAIAGVSAIITFCNKWRTDKAWLTTLALERIKTLPPADGFSALQEYNVMPFIMIAEAPHLAIELQEQSGAKKYTIDADFSNGAWTIVQPKPLPLEGDYARLTYLKEEVFDEKVGKSGPFNPRLRVPNTLKEFQEFQEFWEEALNSFYLYRAAGYTHEELAIYNAVGLDPQIVNVKPRGAQNSQQTDATVAMSLIPLRLLGDGISIPDKIGPVAKHAGFAYINRTPITLGATGEKSTWIAFLVVPAIAEHYELPIQQRIAKVAGSPNWRIGSHFKRAFTELNELTAGLVIPDYPQASATLRSRSGMGGVRTAA